MSLPIAGTELVYKGGSVFRNHIIDIHAKYTGAKEGNTRIDWAETYRLAVPDLISALNRYGHELSPSDIDTFPHPPSAFCQETAELYYDFQNKEGNGSLASKLDAVIKISKADRLTVLNSLFVIFETEDVGDVLTHLALASWTAGKPGCDLYFLSTYMMLEKHLANMAEITGNGYEAVRSLLLSVFPGAGVHQIIRHKLFGFGLCYSPFGLEPKLKLYFQVSDLETEELGALEVLTQDTFERVAFEIDVPQDHAFMLGIDLSSGEILLPSKFYFRGS